MLASALRGTGDALVSALLAPCCASCRLVLPRPLDGPVCGACWEAARLTGGKYEGALRDIIHAFKYEGRSSLARPLAALLKASAGTRLDGADAAVPVPLHAWRRIRRGFNQAAALARALELPVVHALWRTRATAAQAGLTARERSRNVDGAFRLSPILPARVRRQLLEGRIVVLVDDVRTTGATLDACTDVLVAAGAREVRAVTVAVAALEGHGGDAARWQAPTGVRDTDTGASGSSGRFLL